MSGAGRLVRRFARGERGAILAEFAMVLPILAIFFGVTVEAARTFWAYQATIAGVRDATRFVARAADEGVCDQPNPDLSAWTDDVTQIVREASNGQPIFPASIIVTNVSPALDCVSAEGLSRGVVPMASVTASLSITFPFASIFRLAGLDLPTKDTFVTDSGRVFGT